LKLLLLIVSGFNHYIFKIRKVIKLTVFYSCILLLYAYAVKDMDLNIGDVLDWEVHAAGRKYVKVRKLESVSLYCIYFIARFAR
jgi:hypothetical protein